MKRIGQSLVGGLLVMFASNVGYLFGARSFFKWVMTWPALFLYRYFPPPAPDQIFPRLGSGEGIVCTLAVATLVYSFVAYLMLWLRSTLSTKPGFVR
jgi:hypothetical protein